MKVSEEFPSYFLGGDEISGAQVPVTIEKVIKETVPTKQGKTEEVISMYFQDKKRGVRLNRTRAKECARLHGDDMDKWAGKLVVLFTQQQKAFGEIHNVIHIKGVDNGYEVGYEEPVEDINLEDIPV